MVGLIALGATECDAPMCKTAIIVAAYCFSVEIPADPVARALLVGPSLGGLVRIRPSFSLVCPL